MIQGLRFVELKRHGDDRGQTFELGRIKELASSGFDLQQITVSNSKAGTFRGMHFPKPGVEQHKIVYCLKGSILDVALLATKTPNEGPQYQILPLTEDSCVAIGIEPKLAHGFLALEDSIVIYLSTTAYLAANEDQYSIDSLPEIVSDLESSSKMPRGNWILSDRDKNARSY